MIGLAGAMVGAIVSTRLMQYLIRDTIGLQRVESEDNQKDTARYEP